MKENKRKKLLLAIVWFYVFALWTIVVRFCDVRPIGPRGSSVGLAVFNGAFHRLTGVHMALYTLTDWSGLLPVAVCFAFAALGLVQWIKRKSIFKVDFSLLILGGFYAVLLEAYLLFECMDINYRPVLINGYLEASYPSSTTLLVLCVMPTAALQLKDRIKNKRFRKAVMFMISVFIAFMVVGRLVSGVHWITDIIGGIFLSAGLVPLYRYFVSFDSDSY